MFCGTARITQHNTVASFVSPLKAILYLPFILLPFVAMMVAFRSFFSFRSLLPIPTATHTVAGRLLDVAERFFETGYFFCALSSLISFFSHGVIGRQIDPLRYVFPFHQLDCGVWSDWLFEIALYRLAGEADSRPSNNLLKYW